LGLLVEVIVLRVTQCKTEIDLRVMGILIHQFAKIPGNAPVMLSDEYLVIIEYFHHINSGLISAQ
jgi:hypothetical protein